MSLISPFYGGLLALLTVVLSLRVSLVRRREKVSIGDGDNKALIKAIRVHSNSIEYIPIGIILLVLLELQGSLAWQMHMAGSALLLSRLMHAYGLGSQPQVILPRVWGMYLTHFVLVGLAIANIILALP